MNVLSRGYNHYKPSKLLSIHAEIDAANKLPKTKKIKFVDIVILRVNLSGSIAYSKPCANCVRFMRTILRTRNYIIKNIYYSNEFGSITKTKLSHL